MDFTIIGKEEAQRAKRAIDNVNSFTLLNQNTMKLTKAEVVRALLECNSIKAVSKNHTYKCIAMLKYIVTEKVLKTFLTDKILFSNFERTELSRSTILYASGRYIGMLIGLIYKTDGKLFFSLNIYNIFVPCDCEVKKKRSMVFLQIFHFSCADSRKTTKAQLTFVKIVLISFRYNLYHIFEEVQFIINIIISPTNRFI